MEQKDQTLEQDSAGFWTVAVFLVDRRYGGPEEGGWWYSTGVRCDRTIPEVGVHGAPRIFMDEQAAQDWCSEANNRLAETVNKGRRPVSSMLSQGVYRAQIYDGWPPESYPSFRPHYE